jgi:hypothetical protein
MADRFFPNDMPGYVEEEAAPAPAAELSSSSSLHTLLSLPYPALAARFLHAALQLKQKATDCMPPLPRLHAAVRSSARVVTIFVVLCRVKLCTRLWRSSVARRGTSRSTPARLAPRSCSSGPTRSPDTAPTSPPAPRSWPLATRRLHLRARSKYMFARS